MSAVSRLARISLFLELLLPVAVVAKVRAGQVHGSVRLDLAPLAATYEVGAPIVLHSRLTNRDGSSLEIPVSSDVTGRHEGYSLAIRNEAGEPLEDPGHEYISLTHSLGSSKSIRPGGTYTRDLTLNYRVEPLKPGKYSVRVVYRPVFLDVRSESQTRSFRIGETPPSQLEDRVSRLAQELRSGADAAAIAPLLGFTGRSSAAVPLIDLLYAAEDGARVAAAEALLYLERGGVRKALVESLRTRGPCDRMVHLLIVALQADPEEVNPLLAQWLEDKDGDARHAAVDGLYLAVVGGSHVAGRGRVPGVLPRLASLLANDPLPRVRASVAAAIGAYRDAAGLDALRSALRDRDPAVSEQAACAVGWIAEAAKPDSTARKEAKEILGEAVRSGGRAAEAGAYWRARVGEP